MLQIYAAKRALIGRFTTLWPQPPAPADPQVAYSWPGEYQRRMVYAGSVRMTQQQAVAEYGALAYETDLVAIYVRSYMPGDDVQAADTDVESMVTAIATDLAANPKLAGGLTWTSMVTGFADFVNTPNPEPAVISVLRLDMQVEGYGV